MSIQTPSHGRREFGSPVKRRDTEKLKMQGVKPKAWTHQDELIKLVGTKIAIGLEGGARIEGTLLAADQFTLKIQQEHIQFAGVFFKSALTYFREVAQ